MIYDTIIKHEQESVIFLLFFWLGGEEGAGGRANFYFLWMENLKNRNYNHISLKLDKHQNCTFKFRKIYKKELAQIKKTRLIK